MIGVILGVMTRDTVQPRLSDTSRFEAAIRYLAPPAAVGTTIELRTGGRATSAASCWRRAARGGNAPPRHL